MKAEDHDGPMGSGCTMNTESPGDGEKDAGHEHNGGGDGAGQRNFGSELASMTPEQLVALMTPEQLVALFTNKQKAIPSLATAARQSPGSESRAPMMSTVAMLIELLLNKGMNGLLYIVALAVAVGAVLFALGVGVYMAPPHYKEEVSNYVNNNVNITAIIEAVLGNRFIIYNPEKKAIDTFGGAILVDENGKDFSTKGKKYKNFKESHICQVKERVRPDMYNITIDNIGKKIGLTELDIEQMKLSQFSEADAYVMSHFEDSSNGMYIYGRLETARNKKLEMDFVVALYKVSWTLPSAAENVNFDDLYAQWSQIHDGADDMVPEQGKNDLEKKLELFIKVNLKGDKDEAATMEESQELKDNLRQLADKMNKKECKAELVTSSKKQKTMDEG